MIISTEKNAEIKAFNELMESTNSALNSQAKDDTKYFYSRNGKKLEEDVYNCLLKSSKGTIFEGTIELVSGISFPDIIANNYFGVEVKSSISNSWKTLGGSILETSRIKGIEKIYLTYGKLADPIEFITRPYEECLSDIVVTHYPRYIIDMKLNNEETIFTKMGTTYDKFRLEEDQISTLTKYYKTKLKPGESVWWFNNAEDNYSPATIKFWNSLSTEEKLYYRNLGIILFPEVVFSNSKYKYNNFAVWLIKKYGILNINIRDEFSAGGKISLQKKKEGIYSSFPAIVGRINESKDDIKKIIQNLPKNVLESYWGRKINKNPLEEWILIMLEYANQEDWIEYLEILQAIFNVNIIQI